MAAHRYWRLLFSAVGSGSAVAVGEVEFHAVGGGADQTGSGTASADSEYPDWVAGNAFADNGVAYTSTGCWSSTNTSLPHWLVYDFGSGNDVIVEEYTLQAHDNAYQNELPAAWQFQYSDNAADWTTVDTQSGISWAVSEVKTFWSLEGLDSALGLTSEVSGDLALVDEIANSVGNLISESSAIQSIVPETLESFVGLSDSGLEPEVGPLTLNSTVDFAEAATADHSTTPGLSVLTLASSFVAQLDVTGVPLISSVLFESDVGSMQWASASDTVTLISAVNGALAADELDSAVALHSTLDPAAVVTASLEHTVVLVDAIGHGFMAGELDSAVAFTSIFSGNLALIALPLDSAVAFSDVAAAVLGLTASSDSAMVLTDALTGQLALLGTELTSYVQLADAARAGALQLMLVLNAETGAVSTYSMTPEVLGLAAIDGVLVLACADGLYALDADADASGVVVWTLKTGYSTLGSEYLKRVQDIDVLCQTDGDLIATLTSGRYGQKQSYSYRLEPLTRDANRDGVIHVGKGVHSVNWQLELQGIGPTEIDSTILTVEPLSRRR